MQQAVKIGAACFWWRTCSNSFPVLPTFWCSLQDPADYSSTPGPANSIKILQTDPVQLSELLSRLSQLQVKPHQQWLQEVLEALQPHLRSLSTAQLSSNLQVLGGWGFMPPEPFMQELQEAVRMQLGSIPMRHIAGWYQLGAAVRKVGRLWDVVLTEAAVL